MKEFERLCNEEPDANVMPCPGTQYFQEPADPNEDPYWVRKIFKDVRLFVGVVLDQIIDLFSTGKKNPGE